MTLRKLGRSIREQRDVELEQSTLQRTIAKHLQRMNDYIALMTNEPEPPTETDETL